MKMKSNSERVGALARRCCVALLFSASLLSPPLAVAAAKPSYVVQAEKNYRQAQDAVTAAQDDLNRLKRQETREGQRALAKRGQWIEPTPLWRKARAAERTLAFAREHERQTFKELNNARDAARTERVGGFPKGEFQPSTSWRPHW